MPVPEDGIPGWERAKLAGALRACDSRALVAFYSHFRPILTERAQLFGIPRAEQSDAVETFLGDMLLKLCSSLEFPKSLHAYVFVSFKRYASRIGKAKRFETNVHIEFAATLTAPTSVVAEQSPQYRGETSHSERISTPDDETAESAQNVALAHFTCRLLGGLSAEDKLILGARAEEMPLREVASLLGINYNAANTRLFRLRSKLRMNAAAVVSRMDGTERGIVERFLRRAREAGARSSQSKNSVSPGSHVTGELDHG